MTTPFIHTCSKKRHTKDAGDSDLIPFEEGPAFRITPADDQYIYEGAVVGQNQ